MNDFYYITICDFDIADSITNISNLNTVSSERTHFANIVKFDGHGILEIPLCWVDQKLKKEPREYYSVFCELRKVLHLNCVDIKKLATL